MGLKFEWERDTVGKVVRVVKQPDRTLLFINSHYHIIAPKDSETKVGDEILYEPYGINFGFLVKGEA